MLVTLRGKKTLVVKLENSLYILVVLSLLFYFLDVLLPPSASFPFYLPRSSRPSSNTGRRLPLPYFTTPTLLFTRFSSLFTSLSSVRGPAHCNHASAVAPLSFRRPLVLLLHAGPGVGDSPYPSCRRLQLRLDLPACPVRPSSVVTDSRLQRSVDSLGKSLVLVAHSMVTRGYRAFADTLLLGE